MGDCMGNLSALRAFCLIHCNVKILFLLIHIFLHE